VAEQPPWQAWRWLGGWFGHPYGQRKKIKNKKKQRFGPIEVGITQQEKLEAKLDFQLHLNLKRLT